MLRVGETVVSTGERKTLAVRCADGHTFGVDLAKFHAQTVQCPSCGEVCKVKH